MYNSMKLLSGTLDDEHKENLPQWVKDFKLVEWGKQTLFYEYLEMGKGSSLWKGVNFVQIGIS